MDIQGYYMNTRKALLVKFADEDFARIKQAAQERRIPKATYVRMLIIRQMELEQGGVHE